MDVHKLPGQLPIRVLKVRIVIQILILSNALIQIRAQHIKRLPDLRTAAPAVPLHITGVVHHLRHHITGAAQVVVVQGRAVRHIQVVVQGALRTVALVAADLPDREDK